MPEGIGIIDVPDQVDLPVFRSAPLAAAIRRIPQLLLLHQRRRFPPELCGGIGGGEAASLIQMKIHRVVARLGGDDLIQSI